MSTAPHFEIDVADFWRDPYPVLARMRREAPIAFVPQLGSTLLTRRDDIFVSEKRIDVFSSDQPAVEIPMNIPVVGIRDAKTSFQGEAEVSGRNELAVRVTDPRAQLEGECPTAVG